MLDLTLALTYPCPLPLTAVLLFLLAAIFGKPPVVNPLLIQALSTLTIKNAAPQSQLLQAPIPQIGAGGKIILISTGMFLGPRKVVVSCMVTGMHTHGC